MKKRLLTLVVGLAVAGLIGWIDGERVSAKRVETINSTFEEKLGDNENAVVASLKVMAGDDDLDRDEISAFTKDSENKTLLKWAKENGYVKVLRWLFIRCDYSNIFQDQIGKKDYNNKKKNRKEFKDLFLNENSLQELPNEKKNRFDVCDEFENLLENQKNNQKTFLGLNSFFKAMDGEDRNCLLSTILKKSDNQESRICNPNLAEKLLESANTGEAINIGLLTNLLVKVVEKNDVMTYKLLSKPIEQALGNNRKAWELEIPAESYTKAILRSGGIPAGAFVQNFAEEGIRSLHLFNPTGVNWMTREECLASPPKLSDGRDALNQSLLPEQNQNVTVSMSCCGGHCCNIQ